MEVMTHLLILCSTHNPSSWQYLQVYPGTDKSLPLLLWACLHIHPGLSLSPTVFSLHGNQSLAVKLCQIMHSTWHLGHAFLWFLKVAFSNRLLLTVESSMHANTIFSFLFSKSVTIQHCFYFLVLFGLTVICQIHKPRGFIVFFFSIQHLLHLNQRLAQF